MTASVTKLRRPQLSHGPLDPDSPNHPKVWRLAELLGVDLVVAYGMCCGLWAGSFRLRDGLIPGKASGLAQMTLSWSLTSVRVSTDEVGDAFVEAGLVDVADDGRWYVHGWHKYGGAAVAAVEEKVRRFGGATGARGGSAAKKNEGECVEVTAAAAAAASNLISSTSSASASASGSDPGAEALQAAGPPPTPFDDDPYEAADAFLAKEVVPGLTVEEHVLADFPALDGRGRRSLREVAMLFLENEATKYPSKRARKFAVLVGQFRRWVEGDYAKSLALLQMERGGDDRERRRTGEAQPAPTGNRGIEQTRALLQQQRELEHAADDATAAEGLAAMRLANQRGAGAAA